MYHILPNYNEHPTDPNYLVFSFRHDKMAEYFGQRLEEQEVKFEKDTDETNYGKTIRYYAIRQHNREKAIKVNLETWAKFRKPFFHKSGVKIGLWLFMLSLISLAIIGFIKN